MWISKTKLTLYTLLYSSPDVEESSKLPRSCEVVQGESHKEGALHSCHELKAQYQLVVALLLENKMPNALEHRRQSPENYEPRAHVPLQPRPTRLPPPADGHEL